MARGHQKAQSRQKNEQKMAKMKKSQSHDMKEQKKAAQKALIYTCPVCRTQIPDVKTFRQHFESKHPKSPPPPELMES
jgi:heterodisulfide reductase subunit B